MGSLTVCNPTVSGRLGTSAIGKTYYVSPTGSDSNNGLTQGLAWQTIAKINSGTYYPGDKILFQGGQTFSSSVGILLNTTTCPGGGGTATYPITIASYGTGKATLSITSLTQHGVRSLNLAFIQIENLNIVGSNAGTWADYHGILFENTGSTLLDGCMVKRCTVSYFPNTGIYFLGGTGTNTGFTNAQVVNCIVSNCITYGIASGIPGTFSINDNTGGFVYPPTNRSHSNIYVGHCLVEKIIGDNAFRYLCGSGIMLANASNPLIEYCIARDCGGGGNNGGGPVGIWVWNCSYAVIQNCEAYNQKTNSNSIDGAGFDIDLNCDNCIIQYCYSHDNQGDGILVYGDIDGNVVRFNVCFNNIVGGNSSTAEIRFEACSAGTQYCYNNTILGKKGFYLLTSTVQVKNNLLVVRSGGTLITKDNTAGIVFNNNTYYELAGTFKVVDGGTTYTSLSAWQSGKSQEASGYFGDPTLTTAYTAGITAPTYSAFGLANLKLTALRPQTSSNAGLIGTDLGFSMGGKDFNGTAIAQPYTKSVGAIAVTITPPSPTLSLSGTATATTGTNATYTISVLAPTAGSTVVFTPTATGSGTITPTTITLNSGNSYSSTFTVQWAAAGSYVVGGSASGFTNPGSINVTVSLSSGSNDSTTVQNYIASQLPNVPSAQRSAIATAMISSVSGQSYYATDIVDAIANSATQVWLSADAAKCYTLSTDSAPNVSLTGAVGKIDPYKGATSFTQDTTGKRPTIQSGGLRFDGVDDYLRAAYSFSTPAGLYVVVKRIGSANQYADFICGDGDRNIGFTTDATNTLVYANSTAANNINLPVTNISALSLVGLVINGSSSAAYNGLTPTTATMPSNSTTAINLGSRGNFDSFTFANVEIQDVIVSTDTTKALMLLRFLKAYRGL